MMIFVEPSIVYENRCYSPAPQSVTISPAPARIHALNGPLAFADGWDECILTYVQGRAQPIRIGSLVSQLRKCVRHRNKSHKEEIKRHILQRIEVLIRSRRLVRVQRMFVVSACRQA